MSRWILLRGLTRDIRQLRFALVDIADGVPRLQVLIALCYATLCLANQAGQVRNAARKLSDELQRQILPDGGHISRNPGALIELLLDLLPLRQTFAARNIPPPPALLNAIDRVIPALRLLRHGDSSLALFNGMGVTAPDRLATVLHYDDARGAAPVSAPHSGYQRLEAADTIVIVDAGPPSPGRYIRDQRLRRGMTLEEVAAKTKIPRASLEALEEGPEEAPLAPVPGAEEGRPLHRIAGA